MMTREEAVRKAKEFLDEKYADQPITIVVDGDAAEEHGWAWAVVFDSQEYLDTGNLLKRPVSRMVVIPKDGSAPGFVPTPFTYEQTRYYLETGVRPQTPMTR